MTRHNDETARGIVIPLAAVASVCLLLTCGVFLFSGPSDNNRDAPVSLLVPTAAAPSVTPAAPTGPPSADPTGSARPTASATPRTPVATAPTATRPADRTAPPTAPRTTAAAPPAVPSSPAAPPAQPPPPPPPTSATATPPADPAKDITVDAVAHSSPWYTSGTVIVSNRTSRTLDAWDLTLVASNRGGFDMFIGDNMRLSTQGTTATATGTRPLRPGASLVISFSLSGRVDAMSCTFTGVPCRVRGIGPG